MTLFSLVLVACGGQIEGSIDGDDSSNELPVGAESPSSVPTPTSTPIPMRQVFDNYFVDDKSRALASPNSVPAAFAFHGGESELQSLDDLGQAIYDHPNFAKVWVGKMCNWATPAPCDQSSVEFLRLVEVSKGSGYRMKPFFICVRLRMVIPRVRVSIWLTERCRLFVGVVKKKSNRQLYKNYFQSQVRLQVYWLR